MHGRGPAEAKKMYAVSLDMTCFDGVQRASRKPMRVCVGTKWSDTANHTRLLPDSCPMYNEGENFVFAVVLVRLQSGRGGGRWHWPF